MRRLIVLVVACMMALAVAVPAQAGIVLTSRTVTRQIINRQLLEWGIHHHVATITCAAATSNEIDCRAGVSGFGICRAAVRFVNKDIQYAHACAGNTFACKYHETLYTATHRYKVWTDQCRRV